MGREHVLHLITLYEGTSEDAFETFMREKYFPAVHTGPTRIGQITGLTLGLRSDTEAPAKTFLLDMEFDGFSGDRLPRIDDEQVQSRFEEFGAKVDYLGTYRVLSALERPGD
jgi:hypothetical protein